MKGWRTVLINLAIAIGGVIVATNWADVLPPSYAMTVTTILIPLVNIIMRAITTTPIGSKN